MRLVLISLIATLALSCSKDQIIDPVGLYNVTTQEGSQTRLGVVTINKQGKDYSVYFDPASGYYGTIKAEIINGAMTIPSQTIAHTTYYGSGRVSDNGNLSMDFSMLSWGVTYKVKVQGNRAK